MSGKYPRTFHLPWSGGASNDDKIAISVDKLINTNIIISEKMDGGCSSLQLDGVYARTHASAPTHPSFDLLKSFHASIKHKIPKEIQLFGENCFAKHSIAYSELPGYFLMFNVKDLFSNTWLAWNDVEMWAEEIGVPTVPVLYNGKVDSEKELQEIVEYLMRQTSCCGGDREGVVARIADGFADDEFSECVQKCVRENHVNTDPHWAHQEIVRNKLKAP